MFFKNSWFLFFLLAGGGILSSSFYLHANPKESTALQELRLDLEEYGRSMHAHKVDIELLHEKVEALQNAFSSYQDALQTGGGVDLEVTKERAAQLEKKVTALEKNTKSLSSDLTLLKDHINETSATLASCEKKLESLEKELSSDIKALKNTLQTIAAYVEGVSSKSTTYIVQSGDTLEKIAHKHKTTIKELKELNQLTNDRIFSGQKLNIP